MLEYFCLFLSASYVAKSRAYDRMNPIAIVNLHLSERVPGAL